MNQNPDTCRGKPEPKSAGGAHCKSTAKQKQEHQNAPQIVLPWHGKGKRAKEREHREHGNTREEKGTQGNTKEHKEENKETNRKQQNTSKPKTSNEQTTSKPRANHKPRSTPKCHQNEQTSSPNAPKKTPKSTPRRPFGSLLAPSGARH